MRHQKHIDTYHVKLGKRRTTVTLDSLISSFLAIKLGAVPETLEAHGAVRIYLQDKLDGAKDPGRILVSQWLRKESIMDLVDSKISTAYWRWFDKYKF